MSRRSGVLPQDTLDFPQLATASSSKSNSLISFSSLLLQFIFSGYFLLKFSSCLLATKTKIIFVMEYVKGGELFAKVA
ncbi:hypothetical protein M0R45_016743 [Rubus argutus]|uniref:Protein kinase domain-containing protein n=1 Tax=Rubus argutus TaxID=59490 RepID=A0AAW1XU85_RUBAR